MPENTTTELADYTFQPWRATGDGPVKSSPDTWQEPEAWNFNAVVDFKRRRVLCDVDVFEDWIGPILDIAGNHLIRCDSCGKIHRDDIAAMRESCECSRWKQRMDELTVADLRRDLFELIDATPNLDWMLRTKFPENVRDMWPVVKNGRELDEPVVTRRDNVWLYASISNQEDAERNIPLLLGCRDLVPLLGVWAEPLLEDIDLQYPDGADFCCNGKDCGCGGHPIDSPLLYGLDHLIVGGESGCTIGNIRDVVKQCKDASVPVYVTHPDGSERSEWPEDLCVWQLPKISERENS